MGTRDDPVGVLRRAVRKDSGKVSLPSALAERLRARYRAAHPRRPGEIRAAHLREAREVRSYEAEYVGALWHLDFHHGISGEPGTGKSVTLRIVSERLAALRDVVVGVVARPHQKA